MVHKIGVIGFGHWGPNICRAFAENPDCTLEIIIEENSEKRALAKSVYPNINVSSDIEELLTNSEVDAVAIITPTLTHANLVETCLLANKHVFVEKPMTNSSLSAQNLINISRKVSRILMVGHIFVYHPTIIKAKEIISQGELGDLYQINMTRTNLGPIRTDVSVAWDLASHDLSILKFLLGKVPKFIQNIEGSWINQGVSDSSIMTLIYEDNLIANIHCSWLNPKKVREITIVGSKKMMVINEMNLNYPITVYDKGIRDESSQFPFIENIEQFRNAIRTGEEAQIYVKSDQPLKLEINHFVDSINKQSVPKTDGFFGMEIVQLLELAETSAAKNGKAIEVKGNYENTI
jgi:predicted dehydrogenase